LLGDAVSELAITRRQFVFRCRSPTEFVRVFRDYYGPVRKAFDVLDESGRDRLSVDLAELANRHNREWGPSVALPSEYVEAIAVVR
jgi:hypothetical protein